MSVDGDVAAGGCFHPGDRKVQPGGVRLPADRADRDAGFDRLDAFPAVEGHSYTAVGFLESEDPAEGFVDLDACRAERFGHHPRHVLVLGHQNPWSGLVQQHPRPQLVEHRRHLRSRRPAADDQERFRRPGQRPGVMMRAEQVRAGQRQETVRAPTTQDDLLRPHPQAVVGRDGVWVDESRSAAVIKDDDPFLTELRKHRRGLPHILDHIANPLEEPTVIQGGFTDIDAEGVQLPGLAKQPGRVGEDPDRHRAIGRGHPAHRVR